MTIRRILPFALCLAVLGVSRRGVAQQSGDVAIGYSNLPNRSPLGTGTGLQLSDGLILHAGVGFEVGYDTNVFYGDNKSKAGEVIGSPILLVVPYLGLTNATRTGIAPSRVFFDLEATAGFRRYLSDAEQPAVGQQPTARKVSDQPGFLPAANGTLIFSSGQALSLGIVDSFVRVEDPPYVGSPNPTTSIIHYVNTGSIEGRWAPGGGRLQGILRYSNTYEAFNADSHYDFADSLSHQLSLDLSWKWLPKTAVFFQATQAYVDYINSPSQPPTGLSMSDIVKHNSYPLHLMLGIRGLVTQKTAVNLAAGYTNGFYSGNGPNPEGFAGHLSANADLTVTPTLLNSLGIGYRHDFQNSIVGNFYNIDSVTVWAHQQVAGRIQISVNGRYEHRNYQFLNNFSRTDNFFQAGGTIDYQPKKWGYLGVGYSLLLNDAGTASDGAPVGATYTKQQIFGRIGVVY